MRELFRGILFPTSNIPHSMASESNVYWKFAIKKPVRRRAWKKPPLLPCRTRSFEHVLLHVELVCLLSASSQGVPATVRTHSVIVLITVQGLLRITNRAGKIC